MFLRKISTLLLAAMLCMSLFTVNAAAVKTASPEQENTTYGSGIALFWEKAKNVSSIFSVSNRTATCKGTITGKPGTTKIVGTMTLYKKTHSGWIQVESWSASTTSSDLLFSETKAITGGYDYKVIVAGNVYQGGTSEYVYEVSAIITCK